MLGLINAHKVDRFHDPLTNSLMMHFVVVLCVRQDHCRLQGTGVLKNANYNPNRKRGKAPALSFSFLSRNNSCRSLSSRYKTVNFDHITLNFHFISFFGRLTFTFHAPVGQPFFRYLLLNSHVRNSSLFQYDASASQSPSVHR